jgi:hypothetical protein
VDELERERLRTLTVECVIELRTMYLRTPGCSVLKHWDQITDRLRSAARQSESPEEWLTAMLRGLQISSPEANSSRCFRDLADYVREQQCAREWLDLLEREFGYLIAVARGVAEQRKKEAATAHV